MDEVLAVFMNKLDEMANDLVRYKQRIVALESEVADREIFIRWSWALTKECSFCHGAYRCRRTGGACRPVNCPLVEQKD